MLQLLLDAQGKGPNLLRTLVMTSANTRALCPASRSSQMSCPQVDLILLDQIALNLLDQ